MGLNGEAACAVARDMYSGVHYSTYLTGNPNLFQLSVAAWQTTPNSGLELVTIRSDVSRMSASGIGGLSPCSPTETQFSNHPLMKIPL